MRIIPSNSATAALRRIPFTLVDATDLFTPEDITVTGVKVSLNIDGGTPANSTNDIVKVAGSTGEYYLELTQSEANQTAGALIRGTLQPTGCALSKLQAQIGPAEVFSATVDANVVSMAANVVTASALAADAVTEIQSGLATAAALTTVDNEIAALQASANAIEADTQDLQAQIGTDGAGLTAIGDTRLANLDAAISTRASQASVDDLPTNAELGTALGTADDAVLAQVALVKAKTDLIPAAPAAVGDIPTAVQNADALLGRSIAGGADGGRTVTSAFRRVRNRVAIAAGTMTVYREDDSTADHTAAVTTSAGDPISEVDPT